MKITTEFLKELNACPEAIEAFEAQSETDSIKLLELMLKKKMLDWANWLIVRVMSYKQYVSYAVFAAEQVIDIYEKKYSDDKRPRHAIEAAKACIEDPSDKNKAYAARAVRAADAAADAVRTAHAAAYAADAAAYAAAAYAARATAYAARAVYAAYAAADAVRAADAAYAEMKTKILKYGIKQLKEQGE